MPRKFTTQEADKVQALGKDLPQLKRKGTAAYARALAFWERFKGEDFRVLTATQIGNRAFRIRKGDTRDQSSVPSAAQVAKNVAHAAQHRLGAQAVRQEAARQQRELVRKACAEQGVIARSAEWMKCHVIQQILTLGTLLSDASVYFHVFACSLVNAQDEASGWITKNVDPAWKWVNEDGELENIGAARYNGMVHTRVHLITGDNDVDWRVCLFRV